MIRITATWNGKYPNLCSGVWRITVNGIALPIPEDEARKPMQTFKTYSTWSFDKNWSETWDEHEAGLPFDEWLKKNKDWIDAGLKEIGFSFSNDDYRLLYDTIREEDFCYGSCGGCI